MLLDIYSSILTTVKTQTTPSYITHSFYINKEDSEKFWSDSSKRNEHSMIITEWEPLRNSTYKKVFYGVTFMIIFDMKK